MLHHLQVNGPSKVTMQCSVDCFVVHSLLFPFQSFLLLQEVKHSSYFHHSYPASHIAVLSYSLACTQGLKTAKSCSQNILSLHICFIIISFIGHTKNLLSSQVSV